MSSRGLQVLVLAAVAAAMLGWTWNRWADPQIDFGGELYAAWRLAEGDVLYRDVAYFTGPLSPYWNALCFAIAGDSVRTLVLANLAVLAAITVALRSLLAKLAGSTAASAATAVFLSLFAFAQLERVGNSNYVTPYSHETTHGALIAIGALHALERVLATGRARWIAASGVLLGLAFLTKVEVFLALAAAQGLGLVLAHVPRGERGKAPRRALVFVASAIVPVLAAWGLLATAMPPSAALEGTLGAWPHVLDQRITDLPFYAWIRGTDRPGVNSGKLLGVAAIEVLGVVALLALAGSMRTRVRGRLPAALVFLAVAGALSALVPPAIWLEAARPWPLYAAALVLVFAVLAWRARGSPEGRTHVLRAAFAAWSLVLLAKMVLNARLQMYGFALAMPATMLVVLALVGWLPGRAAARGGSATLARALMLGIVVAFVVGHLRVMQGYVRRAVHPVGAGADRMLADGRGRLLEEARVELARRTSAADRVVVVPEGVMLDFLARRGTGVRFLNYMPPELLMFGEDTIRAELAAAAPEYVVFVTKVTAEYGLPFFGRDYGRSLWRWIEENYVPVFARSDPATPIARDVPFGVQILERKDRVRAVPK